MHVCGRGGLSMSYFVAELYLTCLFSFAAVNCSPRVAEIEQLNEALRRGAIGLPDFLREMRCAFIESVASSN